MERYSQPRRCHLLSLLRGAVAVDDDTVVGCAMGFSPHARCAATALLAEHSSETKLTAKKKKKKEGRVAADGLLVPNGYDSLRRDGEQIAVVVSDDPAVVVDSDEKRRRSVVQTDCPRRRPRRNDGEEETLKGGSLPLDAESLHLLRALRETTSLGEKVGGLLFFFVFFFCLFVHKVWLR